MAARGGDAVAAETFAVPGLFPMLPEVDGSRSLWPCHPLRRTGGDNGAEGEWLEVCCAAAAAVAWPCGFVRAAAPR